ncbi:MAG: endo-1,4-beta-xylanase [Phycisphaerales bacterium]|nr:MAG: endo-1,4-beta-xylanase [Phycisphaerales bacterium]
MRKGNMMMNWSRVGVAITLVHTIAPFAARAGASDIDEAIRQHRMGTLIIETKPGVEVQIEQLRHEFWFGAAISSSAFSGRFGPEDERRYKEVFLANFNAGVTENALKWHAMERRQGRVDHTIVDAILAWTSENNIPLRGHCLFWGVPGRVQNWVKQLDDETLRETIKSRATTIARRYRGRFAEYDLNNEMIHRNYYAERLGPGITKQMAEWVKQGDPKAKLFVNDYDILTGKRLDDYVTHIRGLLQDGVLIDGIGVQGHLHKESFDPSALRHALDKLGQIGLPIRVTEFNMPGQRSRYYQNRDLKLTPDQEQARARALTDYYRICFAHPAVHGILMWGFWERANWIPQSSLYRRDWTPTPAADAYRGLVFNQWWTRWNGKAGADGRCRVRAFYGKHRIAADGQEKTVNLDSTAGKATVSFR